VKLNENLLRHYEQIKENEKTKKETVLDARPIDQYFKIDLSTGNSNHFKSTINVPYTDIFDTQNGTIKSKEKLTECKIYSNKKRLKLFKVKK
jgi:3-mercaptopyruvate sulfurtransferase SseA